MHNRKNSLFTPGEITVTMLLFFVALGEAICGFWWGISWHLARSLLVFAYLGLFFWIRLKKPELSSQFYAMSPPLLLCFFCLLLYGEERDLYAGPIVQRSPV